METKPNIFCEKPWKINGFLLVLPFMVKWILADSSTIINVMEQSIMPHMCALSQRISALFKDTQCSRMFAKTEEKAKTKKMSCSWHFLATYGQTFNSPKIILIFLIFCIVSSYGLKKGYRINLQKNYTWKEFKAIHIYVWYIHISCTLIRKRVINTKI